jgi:hypothetical protein
MQHPAPSNLLRWFVLLLYKLQDLFCLFARWLPFALSPSHKCLSRNSQCVGDSRGVLGYNVAIVSQSGVLLFGRFHLLTISELVATVSHYSFGGRSKRPTQEMARNHTLTPSENHLSLKTPQNPECDYRVLCDDCIGTSSEACQKTACPLASVCFKKLSFRSSVPRESTRHGKGGA